MGYARGIRWSDEVIELKIKDIIKTLCIETMPTSSQIISVTKETSLCSAIERYGGYKYWADKLGLKQNKCTTRDGLKGEVLIKEKLEELGYKVDKMSVRHPYDLLVNDNIKIDVKTSKLYKQDKANWSFYTFNLEKVNPTCDIYILISLNDNDAVKNIYIIPSKLVRLTQISIGSINSKYEKYIDKYDYIEMYDNFYKTIK